MPIYVLDTDTITHVQASRQAVLTRLKAVPHTDVYTTVITMREQLRGRLAIIDQANEGVALVQAYAQLLATIEYFTRINILPMTDAASEKLRLLRTKQLRVGTQDLRIASIVLSVNGILVTSNKRDFEKVPELQIEDWNR